MFIKTAMVPIAIVIIIKSYIVHFVDLDNSDCIHRYYYNCITEYYHSLPFPSFEGLLHC